MVRRPRPHATLERHAAAWVDMEPHAPTLRTLAGHSRIAVEFGVRGAVSTWAILDGLPSDGRLYSVDIDPHCLALVPERVKNDPRWVLYIGDDLDTPLPPSADLFFIDTTHEADQTAAELAVAERLRPRWIVLHDWVLPGVWEPAFDFVRRTDYRITIVEPSPWGMAVLERAP